MDKNFAGAAMREKQNAKMRFEFPPQESQTLAEMFGFIEVRVGDTTKPTPQHLTPREIPGTGGVETTAEADAVARPYMRAAYTHTRLTRFAACPNLKLRGSCSVLI